MDTTTLKRIYRLSAEATGPAAAAKGILTASEVDEMIAGLTRLEDDGSSVVVKFPDMWVIARKQWCLSEICIQISDARSASGETGPFKHHEKSRRTVVDGLPADHAAVIK